MSATVRNDEWFDSRREIVVDDERDLLNIDSSSEQIGGDEDSGRTRSEFLHDDFSLSLFHISVHGCSSGNRQSESRREGETLNEPETVNSRA